MLFINPFAGKGMAQKNFYEIENTLVANGYVIEPILTEYKGHAEEIMRTMPAEKFRTYYQFLVSGGDGSVNEIINGYFKRNKDEPEESKL